MLTRIEQLSQEYNLKFFYTIAGSGISQDTSEDALEKLVLIAPFIRQFQTRFVNFYQLSKLPALRKEVYDSRLAEFYSEWAHQVLHQTWSENVVWLLSQEIEKGRLLFPKRPITSNYQDIMRSLSVLIEFFRINPVIDLHAYAKILRHVQQILSPEIDEDFDDECKTLLEKLNSFNARKEGNDSEKYRELEASIQRLNQNLSNHIISNNTFVSITQQITEINKALKTVKRKDFENILSKDELSKLWKTLSEFDYAGGENYLYGDYSKQKAQLTKSLLEEFPHSFEAIGRILEKSFYSPELPPLNNEAIPEAIQLYCINLIGELGFRNEESIKLILTYHSRFVDRMVREGAQQALRKNSEAVQTFFLESLGNAPDYEHMLIVADKHDSIFEHISPTILTKSFGEGFQHVLEELSKITAPDGILLSNFIRSAYLRKFGSDLLPHFTEINNSLICFKTFVDHKSDEGFISLIRMWGLDYIVSWALTDFEAEDRLFSFIVKAAAEIPLSSVTKKDRVIPMQEVISLLSKEHDAKDLIQKLMTFLLNSKISFDYRLFSSLFQVVAQRQQQFAGGISIRDGFSEQRGYSQSKAESLITKEDFNLEDPHIFHPIVIFLITVLHMKTINIPKDAFVETDISLYLNSLAEHQKNPELGYQIYLANQLISSIPYIKDFSSQHETVIRKTIADLDESYKRKNILYHYHRIKIHRAPSKLDLDFCLEILEGLTTKDLPTVLENLVRLMKGIGDEAVPDLRDYFNHYENKLKTLSSHLKTFKGLYFEDKWEEIAEDPHYAFKVRELPGIDADSAKDIVALVKLVNALSNYWTQRINKEFLSTYLTEREYYLFNEINLLDKLDLVREKRKQFQSIVKHFDPNLEPYQHIFLKRHVIQGDWNFDFFGFWPYYKEIKFEAFNADRRLSELERQLLQTYASELFANEPSDLTVNEKTLAYLQTLIDCLKRIMIHLVDEGLSPSKFFLDTIEILKQDQLTISQLHDILGILNHRELSHIDSFIANTFGHFPARITRALGRENLDFDLDKLDVVEEELLYPLVQETVLGHIIAGLFPNHILEEHLNRMLELTSQLKKIAPSQPIFQIDQRLPGRLTPVFYGYKSYALQTLAQDGFNVPALETLTVDYYLKHPQFIENPFDPDYKNTLIDYILRLEQKTGKWFDFNNEKLSEQQQEYIKQKRQQSGIDISSAGHLLLSARSGSYRSMPGILGTVLNVGLRNAANPEMQNQSDRLELEGYRMFLSTFGNVVFGINEIQFSRIVESLENESETDKSIKIIEEFKHLIENRNQESMQDNSCALDWDDPLEMLCLSTIGVWNSWFSESAVKLRNFLDISADWYTPVTLMEMKQGDKNDRSFSAILFSGDPQGKTNRPHGDILFGKPGEEIASGLAAGGAHLEDLEVDDPKLYSQIADLLEQIKINKGYINVDVEMVGEYHPEEDCMELFVVQERQMPLGTRGESEDYRLKPTDILPVATGKGVNGGVQHGVFLDGFNQSYLELKEMVAKVRAQLGEKDEFHGPGIFLLMKYVTPEEALKMNIEGVDGVITTKIGKSSHASIAAKRDGKLFVCEASLIEKDKEWFLGNRKIKLGNTSGADIFTVVGNPKSVSPYSGNIYDGALPLIQAVRKR